MPHPAAFVHLHCRSWFSFLRGGSSPERLVERAVELGQEAVAVTDWMGVSGAVRLERAARAAGVRPVVGAEVLVEGAPLVLLCASRAGYSTLCRLLTRAHQDRRDPGLGLDALRDDGEGLLVLTGGREGRLRALLEAGERDSAMRWARSLAGAVPGRVLVELSTHRRPGEGRALRALSALAREAGLPALATNDARFADPGDLLVHDLLACARLGVTVHDRHPERPVNDAPHLSSAEEMARAVFDPVARANTLAVARECDVSLLAEGVTPPGALVPRGETAASYLRRLCLDALPAHYGARRRAEALAQLEKELAVVERLDLCDFFLVVREVTEFARLQGVRCAGRGSAANSVVAYLLGITGVDPLEHNLVFERFLHVHRQGAPDIDVDFASHRRDEVIRWVEERFAGHSAMTANLNTYGLRGSVKDVAKALGWPHATANEMTRNLPWEGRPGHAAAHRDALEEVVGPSPLLEVLLAVVPRLEGCPRHLSVHSGGMLLTRGPVTDHTPTLVSTGGIRQAVYDKEDAEGMGLVKFDILGLRALSVVGEAAELHERATGERLDVDGLPLDDPAAYELVLSGETVGLFQVESPGQIATIAKHRPRNFRDLVAQVSLLRPGPILGNAVHPYIRRSRGLEPVEYDHPCLEPVLKDTFGTLLYQEQVLQVASAFAGFGLAEADEFRRLTSKFRDRSEMEALRGRFVAGALAAHADLSREVADRVFDRVAAFSGYGFPRAHAVAFARTAYTTAWLKARHPAAYLAAVLEHAPGMYPRQTIVEEARRRGVPVLPPCLVSSALGFSLERRDDGRLAIRFPLEAVAGVGRGDAASLLLERAARPFSGVEDLYRRSRAPRDALWALGRAGALDAFGPRRKVLWALGALENRLGPPGVDAPPLVDAPALEPADLPALPALSRREAAAWDHAAARATAGPHPMALLRAELDRAGIAPISRAWGGEATVAGLVVVRQRPSTGKGVVFITLEDEGGRMQCLVRPETWEAFKPALRSGALIVTGRVQRQGSWWRGLVVAEARRLAAVGGRAGGPRA